MLSEAEIAEAITGNEFVLYYQPKISMVTGKIYGAEALARLTRPDGTVILPEHFIKAAEQSGQIKELTRHLFARLIDDLRSICLAESSLVVSFNASARDFDDDTFTRKVLQTLDESGVPVSALQIELTETALLQAGEDVRQNILPLYEAGVGLAMDDFGTGYSSLEMLSKWPFTTIKLDQGMVQRMFDSEKDLTIVENTIRMAHELGINVVAEGVEDYEQYHRLLVSGCTRVQGFWISKPLPLAQFIEFVKEDLSWSGLPVGLIHLAIVDHVHWRRKLVGEVVRAVSQPQDAPGRQRMDLPPLSSHDSRLGHWYDGEGQVFKERPAFRDLAAPQQELEQIAHRLVAQVHAGADTDDIIPDLRQLSDCSMKLLELLHTLEYQGMLDMHQALSNWTEHALGPASQAA